MRRIRLLQITESLFLELFMAGKHPAYELLRDPIPKDAKIVNVYRNPFNVECWCFILESEEFDLVPVNSPIPELLPTIRAAL